MIYEAKPLTEEQEMRLSSLQNLPTRYEVSITDGNTILRVGYTAKKSRDGVIACLRRVGQEVVNFTGCGEFFTSRRAADGVMMGNWRIAFTGRTQREAIMQGELKPFWKEGEQS